MALPLKKPNLELIGGKHGKVKIKHSENSNKDPDLVETKKGAFTVDELAAKAKELADAKSPKARLSYLHKALTQMIPLAQSMYMSNPSRANSMSYTNLCATFQDLEMQLQTSFDFESIARSLYEDVIQGKIQELIKIKMHGSKNIIEEISQVLNNSRDIAKVRQIIANEDREFGQQLENELPTYQTAIYEYLVKPANAKGGKR